MKMLLPKVSFLMPPWLLIEETEALKTDLFTPKSLPPTQDLCRNVVDADVAPAVTCTEKQRSPFPKESDLLSELRASTAISYMPLYAKSVPSRILGRLERDWGTESCSIFATSVMTTTSLLQGTSTAPLAPDVEVAVISILSGNEKQRRATETHLIRSLGTFPDGINEKIDIV